MLTESPDGACGDPYLTENPNITYRDARPWCDRDGVLGSGTDPSNDMLPIAEVPSSPLRGLPLRGIASRWLRLCVAAKGLVVYSGDGRALVVPGVPEAGEDSDAALDAVWAFRKRLLAAAGVPA